MKRLLPFCILLVFFGFYLPAWGLLNLSGIPEKNQIELKKKFPFLDSTNPSPFQIDEILRFLMSKGSFERAQIEQIDNENLMLKVRFLKTIKSVKISGEDEIDDIVILRTLNLAPGDRFEPTILIDIQTKIKQLYKERGFHNSQVDIQTKINPDQTVELNLVVREGYPIRIEKLEVSCKNEALKKQLDRLIRGYKNKILTSSILQEIQTELTEELRQNRYIRADVIAPKIIENQNQTTASILFPVLKTEQYSVSFQGNYNYSSPTLRDALNLETFYSANPNLGSELSKRIKDFYLNRGYAKFEIDSEELNFIENESASIRFTIKEGKKIKISKYEIKGDFSRDESYYSNFIIQNSSQSIQSKIFKRDDLDQSINNLITELQNQGFLKAKLKSTRYQFNRDKDQVTVIVDFDEGPLTRVKNLLFSGVKSLTVAELKEILKLENGSPLRLIDLELGLKSLKTEFQMRGFLEVKILNEKDPSLVTYNNENTEATIEIKISEGPRVRVNSIIIDGNTITREYVIRKEIDFKEGDILNPEKINESIRRLQKTGLFSTVEIKTLEENTQIASRTVIIKVYDRNPGLFNIGTGLTNERDLTLRGFVGLAYRNLDGLAKAVSGRVDLNYNVPQIQYPEYKVTFGYLEPYLWNTRIKGRVNVTRSVQVTDYEKRQATDIQNATFSIEQNVRSNILVSYDIWGINTIKDFPIDDRSTADEKIQNIGTLGPGVEFDFRDHPFSPTSGSITRFNIEYSHPYIGSSEGIEYLKSTASLTHYTPFKSKTWIWANQVRGGTLENLSDLADGGVPYSKKGFTLGGLSTIRGFEAGSSERFPNDTDLQSDDYYLKTTANFALIKSEIRFPFIGDLGGAFFYDGGFVAIEGLKFEDYYRDAAGFGLRYSTPVGPVNLEMAWKLDRKKDRDESPYRFHFSIGSF